MDKYQNIPVLGVAGWSGSGKTTLITALIPILAKKGIKTAVIKHDVHGVAEDETGKDSWLFKKAGAAACILCGPKGPDLNEALHRIADCDLIIVEGFKKADIPKIGLASFGAGIDWTEPPEGFLALVSDEYPGEGPQPWFHRDDTEGIADWIEKNVIGS